ncbi:hypothetical protein [Arthrospira platensis]|uniref:hypothetical protein n=1 Tax=Limnospira platensis TaxID=118562 RepID=UPI000AFF030F
MNSLKYGFEVESGKVTSLSTITATPSFGNHNPRIEAGNGRREVEPTTKCDHCQPSMIRETECPA